YKLGIKFGRADMVKRFLHSRCTGFYFRVVKEGEVEAGDAIALVHRDPGNVTVADITRLYAFDRNNAALLRRVLDLAALPEDWRAYFREKAAAPAG
ncbi:MAG: 3-alpha domain-containing protein, partial [Candidatus Acidiferrales bacterium]